MDKISRKSKAVNNRNVTDDDKLVNRSDFPGVDFFLYKFRAAKKLSGVNLILKSGFVRLLRAHKNKILVPM
jgi:hypothetical protein